jgi:GNAT superfamily N-acetyltransferase
MMDEINNVVSLSNKMLAWRDESLTQRDSQEIKFRFVDVDLFDVIGRTRKPQKRDITHQMALPCCVARKRSSSALQLLPVIPYLVSFISIVVVGAFEVRRSSRIPFVSFTKRFRCHPPRINMTAAADPNGNSAAMVDSLSSPSLQHHHHQQQQEPSTTLQSSNQNNNNHTIQIVRVTCQSEEHFLLRQGVQELFQLYFEELRQVGCDLDFQGFQSEWTDLPGKYDFTKRGGLFVALDVAASNNKEGNNNHPVNHHKEENTVISSSSMDHNDRITSVLQVVGCVALRPLDESNNSCEVKRMYIRESHRRLGIGNLLAKAVIDHSWDQGYDVIQLDSLERLVRVCATNACFVPDESKEGGIC